MKPSPGRTRVAVVQLDYLPTVRLNRQSPIENPLFDLRGGMADLGTSASDGLSDTLKDNLKRLRQCVREVYCDNLMQRLKCILKACQSWNVELVVFPEYSIPAELLKPVAELSQNMTIVAGTHMVEAANVRAGVYEQLGWSIVPESGQAVCPVIHDFRLIALQPKLSLAKPEVNNLDVGHSWSPVELPGVDRRLGVLICLDFLYRERPEHRELIGPQLDHCRLLAVPSLTPHFTTEEFAAQSMQEALRYRRPVLFADWAAGGGSSIVIDNGRVQGRDFPDVVGRVPKGDEGVLIADIDLGFAARGESTTYGWTSPVETFAAASLLYERHPRLAEYGQFTDGLLSSTENGTSYIHRAVEELKNRRALVLDAADIRGSVGSQLRGQRLRRLFDELDGINRPAELKKFLREIRLPGAAFTGPDIRAVLARGCSELLDRWSRSDHGESLRSRVAEFRNAGASVAELDSSQWSDDAASRVAEIIERLRAIDKVDQSPVERIIVPPISDSTPLRSLGIKKGGRCDFSLVDHKIGLLIIPDDWQLDVATEGRGVGVRYQTPPVIPHLHEYFRRMQIQLVANGMPDVAQLAVRWGSGSLDLFVLCRSSQRLLELYVLNGDADATSNESIPFANHKSNTRCLSIRVGKVLPSISGLIAGGQGFDPDKLSNDDRLAIILEELASIGVPVSRVVTVTSVELEQRTVALRDRIGSAGPQIDAIRNRLLADVAGQFVEPSVFVNASETSGLSFITAADEWLTQSDTPTLLVLGEYGSGKSTSLAEWCWRHWHNAEAEIGTSGLPTPMLVFVSLVDMPKDTVPLDMILLASRAELNDANRAAVQLLIMTGHLIPVFDGFDEMATRVTPETLGQQLASLLSVAQPSGRVVISSRDHYFPSVTDLDNSWQQALAESLSQSSSIRRLLVRKFDGVQIRQMVRNVVGDERAEEVAHRIEHQYPLEELAQRPLLLAMVLKTIDQFDVRQRISRADLYQAYLQRWLDQSAAGDAEIFSPDQKIAFAQRVAARLWKSGQSSLSVVDLEHDIRGLLTVDARRGTLLGSDLLEICGGSFFVREGDDRYRFAHKSFLEFFLARHLIESTDREGHEISVQDRFTTKPITSEVAGFVLELLKRDGSPERHPFINEMQRWLKSGRRGRIDETADAATNVVRLFLRFRHWDEDLPSLFLKETKLNGITLHAETLKNLTLVSADLSDAKLINCRIENCHLKGSRLDRTSFNGSTLVDTDLKESRGKSTNFTAVAGNGVNLDLCQFTDAIWEHSTWITTSTLELELLPQTLEPTASAAHVLGANWLIGPPATLPATIAPAIVRGHKGVVFSVSFDSSGGRIASAGSDGTVRVWDATSFELLSTLEGHNGSVLSVSFDSSGGRIASAGDDGTARVWDATSFELVSTLEGHQGSVLSVSFDSSAGRIASAGEDGTVRVWDATSFELLSTLEGHNGSARSVSFDSSGGRIASAGSDGTVRVWDGTSFELLSTLERHNGTVRSVSFDSSGGRIASAGEDGTVRVWDATSFKLLSTLEGHNGSVSSVSFNSSGGRIASAGDDGTARVWDATSFELVSTLEGHKGIVWSVSFNSCAGRIASAGEDGTVRVWDATSFELVSTLEGHKGSVLSVSFDPSGGRIASAGVDGTVRVWDATSYQLLSTLEGHNGSVLSVSFDPSGGRIASAGSDGTVRVWDGTSFQLLSALKAHSGFVRSVRFDSLGGRLASAGFDGMVCVWDATSFQLLSTLKGHDDIVWSVSFDSSGRRMASAGHKGTVRVWDSTSYQLLSTLEGHKGPVLSVSFDPSGRWIITAGSDRIVRVWDAKSCQLLNTLEGHKAYVWSMSFDQAKGRIASSDNDGTVRVWDALSFHLLSTLEGDKGPVFSVSFDSLGGRLASAGSDGTVRVWNATDSAAISEFVRLDCLNQSWLACTSSGFAQTGDDSSSLRLRVQSDWKEKNGRQYRSTCWYPMDSVRSVFTNQERFAESLAGQATRATLVKDLIAAGMAIGADAVTVNDASEVTALTTLGESDNSRKPTPPSIPTSDIRLDNPFRPGAGMATRDQLFGRDDVLNRVASLMQNAVPCVIRGPRRSGKTWLLAAIEADWKAKECLVLKATLESGVNSAKAVSNLRTRDDVALLLKRELAVSQSPANDLSDELTKLVASGQRPLVILDEIVHLKDGGPDLFAWLRSLGQQGVGVVLAGSHWDWCRVVQRALESPGSSFGNDIKPVDLLPLTDDKASQFLLQKSPTELDLANPKLHTLDWVVKRCGAWQFYLQVMGFELVEEHRSNRRESFIDELALDDLYQQKLLDEHRQVFQSRWTDTPSAARRVLLMVRDGRLPPLNDLAPPDRRIVRDCGLVNYKGEWLHDPPNLKWIEMNRDELSIDSSGNEATR